MHAALNLFRVFGLPIKLTERADLNMYDLHIVPNLVYHRHHFVFNLFCARNIRFDPFFGDNLVDSDLPLEDIKKEIVVQAPAKTATEVRNLGKMCFGNLDVSIRLIAFQQLSAALSAASNSLFNTLQKDWFLLLAQVYYGNCELLTTSIAQSWHYIGLYGNVDVVSASTRRF